ncbi:MAG: hypothetical protein WCB44_20555 [Stellaceae bacterium]
MRSSRQTKTAARLLLAQVLEGNIELVAHLITHHAADADPAWLGQGFEPCRDIDPVSEDVLALDNDIAKIDPDSELDMLLWRDGRISLRHAPLNLDSAAHRSITLTNSTSSPSAVVLTMRPLAELEEPHAVLGR